MRKMELLLTQDSEAGYIPDNVEATFIDIGILKHFFIVCFSSFKLSEIPRPVSSFTADQVEVAAYELMEESVRQIGADQFVCDPRLENAPPVKAFADACVARCQELRQQVLPPLMTLITGVVLLVWETVHVGDGNSLGSKRRQAMWRAFTQLRYQLTFRSKVKEMLQELSNIQDVPNLFLQLFVQALFNRIMARHEAPPPAAPQAGPVETLTRRQENALRYTAGYIVSRLPRKLKRTKELKNESGINQVLDNMTKGAKEENTRLNYTKEWVSTRTRGGLCLVNDSTFMFFSRMEVLVKTNLPTSVQTLSHMDIRPLVLEPALKDHKLLQLWDELVKEELQENSSLAVLQLIVDFYTQVRGFSFARVIMEKFKIMEKAHEKKGKSLRTGLKRAHEDPSASGGN